MYSVPASAEVTLVSGDKQSAGLHRFRSTAAWVTNSLMYNSIVFKVTASRSLKSVLLVLHQPINYAGEVHSNFWSNLGFFELIYLFLLN